MASEALTASPTPSSPSVASAGTSTTPHQPTQVSSNQNRTLILRIAFVVSLFAAAAFCGVVSYWVVDDLERSVGIQTYESVALSALENAKAITRRKFEGAEVIASVLSNAFPDSEQWPMINLDGYVETAQKLAQLSDTVTVAINVLVKPNETEAFEEHAKFVYQDQEYPETAGISDFGYGIWKRENTSESENTTYPDGRLPDKTGVTDLFDSPNQILAPIFLHNDVNARSLLFNVHSSPPQGAAIDSMLECAKGTHLSPFYGSQPDCTAAIGFVELIIKPGPSALLYGPIYAANDPKTIVALTGTTLHVEEVLTSVVPTYVEGLDCVVSTDTESFTYVIHNGIPKLVGIGDLHQRNFDSWGRSVVLNDMATGTEASKTFTLTVYPTNLMLDAFRTNSPVAIAVGFVFVILFCAAIFLGYDFIMRGEARHQKAVLEIKRRFVRFVSHEIRTPLNTVCMGLELLRSELGSQIDTTTTMEANAKASSKDEDADEEIQPLISLQDKDAKDSSTKKVEGAPALAVTLNYLMDLTGDILDNSESAVTILNDLLNYDKIETGTFQLEVDVVPIWSLVRKTVSAFDIQARKRSVKLNVTVDERGSSLDKSDENNDVEKAKTLDLSTLNVIGDDMRLRQVLLNLVSNSLKFVEENVGVIDVTASYCPDGLPGNRPLITSKDGGSQKPEPISYPRDGAVKIRVTDNGEGMTEEQLHLLFREGVQFDANKLQAGGGSGLGLYITKGLVEQHGGMIEVESQGRGCGSTFTIYLPLYHCASPTERDRSSSSADTQVPADPGAKKAPDGSTSNSAPSPPARQRHILVVDDAAMNRKMLIRLLERAGHKCDSAANGQEALDAVIADQESAKSNEAYTPYDTILMDYEMPVLNGPDATKLIRTKGCSAFIVGVTGNVLVEDVNYFKSKGADFVLAKPLKVSSLNEAWEKHKL